MSAGANSSCLTAKGLDISLAALQRQDPYINNIVDVACQVALYTYNNRTHEWEKTEVEGTLFIYTRLASPRHGFTIKNRLSMENLTEPITKDLDFQLQDPFLLYRNARLAIHGIWFYDKEDCHRIAQMMKILTQQEQAVAQSQGGWLSPDGGGGGRGGDAKAVDIIQMLTKARSEYDKEKSTSEPKEIGGSSVLFGNPNLIKPIPVKPNTQDGEGAEPKPLSLATLFGTQPQHPFQPDPVSPLASSGTGSSSGRVARPHVARTLTYGDAVCKNVTSAGGNIAHAACSAVGVRSVIGGQTVQEDGRVTGPKVVQGSDAGVLTSPTSTGNKQQHSLVIQKLVQGQRGVGGVLQTVSESPENRLCDNGVPLEHHHHHHHLQQQQQVQADPLKRLFQIQPPPPPPPTTSITSLPPPPYCPNHPALHQAPLVSSPPSMDFVSLSQSQPQTSQTLFFNLSKPRLQHSSQSTAGLLPSQVLNGQGLQLSQGPSSHMSGVVSPHELLHKLQLVQQKQSWTSHDPPRHCPALAPRFFSPVQSQGTLPDVGPGPNQTAVTTAQKSVLQFQVNSPQTIPATVAPTLLLSPSVFTQAKSSSGLPAVTQDSCLTASTLPRPPSEGELRVLSRNQLQATLLHLIQTDGSFLDTIYEAFVRQLAVNSTSKY
ncbi:mRNA-decapping enzyme 1B [Thalassophryne amazonica]|uniref:mRNA-decapping enzyme 1B n=1 Tax=Thalassophryne amazonica TaxID=390379 RepID=UPI001470C817|nr:mRNA-decapping enzyme 1B [Thalassophryne amazonica]